MFDFDFRLTRIHHCNWTSTNTLVGEDITGMAVMHLGVSPQWELDYIPQLIAITTTPISLDLADQTRLAIAEAWDMNF